MKRNRLEIILLFVIAFFLFIVLGVIIYINLKSRSANKHAFIKEATTLYEESTTPPSPYVPPIDRPQYQTNQQTVPPVKYDYNASLLLVEKLKNRKPLSQSDREAKSTILKLLPEDKLSGLLHKTQSFVVFYNSAPDAIQVEIRSTDIDFAKNEAVNWFISQGFSREAVCDLPVHFYLSRVVKEALRNSNTIVNPLAPDCK